MRSFRFSDSLCKVTGVIFVVSGILFSRQFDNIDNTFRATQLVLTGVLAGLCIALILLYSMAKAGFIDWTSSDIRWVFVPLALLSCCLIALSAASIVNRYASSAAPQDQPFIVEEIHDRYGRLGKQKQSCYLAIRTASGIKYIVVEREFAHR
jgi:hypothetical protein